MMQFTFNGSQSNPVNITMDTAAISNNNGGHGVGLEVSGSASVNALFQNVMWTHNGGTLGLHVNIHDTEQDQTVSLAQSHFVSNIANTTTSVDEQTHLEVSNAVNTVLFNLTACRWDGNQGKAQGSVLKWTATQTGKMNFIGQSLTFRNQIGLGSMQFDVMGSANVALTNVECNNNNQGTVSGLAVTVDNGQLTLGLTGMKFQKNNANIQLMNLTALSKEAFLIVEGTNWDVQANGQAGKGGYIISIVDATQVSLKDTMMVDHTVSPLSIQSQNISPQVTFANVTFRNNTAPPNYPIAVGLTSMAASSYLIESIAVVDWVDNTDDRKNQPLFLLTAFDAQSVTMEVGMLQLGLQLTSDHYIAGSTWSLFQWSPDMSVQKWEIPVNVSVNASTSCPQLIQPKNHVAQYESGADLVIDPVSSCGTLPNTTTTVTLPGNYTVGPNDTISITPGTTVTVEGCLQLDGNLVIVGTPKPAGDTETLFTSNDKCLAGQFQTVTLQNPTNEVCSVEATYTPFDMTVRYLPCSPLSPGAIAGIVVGSVVFLALVVTLVLFLTPATRACILPNRDVQVMHDSL